MQIIISRNKAVLLLVVALLLINTPLLLNKLELNNGSVEHYNTEILYFLATLLAVIALSYNQLLFKVVGSTTLIISSILLYFIINYKITINYEMVRSILNTDTREVLELLKTEAILLIATILAAFALLSYMIKIDRNSSTKHAICFLVVSASIFSAYLVFNKEEYLMKGHFRNKIGRKLSYYLPLSYVYHSYKYLERSVIKDSIKPCGINVKMATTNDDLNLILIIGESARADRFSLNGYSRDTNPRLKQIKNLINYSNVQALGTSTLSTAPKLLKNNKQEPCLLKAMNTMGFKTKWVTINSSREEIETLKSEAHIVHGISEVIAHSPESREPFDEYLLDYLSTNNIKIKTFTVLHTAGSHEQYDRRTPKKFKKFSPHCGNEQDHCMKDLVALNNSYDNTILYTDYFLSEAIDKMKNENALLVYISDHGESLGENGLFLHNHPPEIAPQETHIPMIWWASDKFLSNPENHKRFMMIRKNRFKNVDQSYIFNSILDCIGAESSVIDQNKSVCRKLK